MHVAVLLGGRSPEHDVSVRSGLQVLRHLDRARHVVRPVLLDRDGRWWPAAEPLVDIETSPERLRADSVGPMRPGAAVEYLLGSCGVEVVFPVLHGKFGEDGTVQGMLELHDVPFVGSGCAASAVAMDKIRTRECLQAYGIPMPDAYVATTPLRHADPAVEGARIRQHIGFPCFVKVDLSGSTIGVRRVADEAALAEFLTEFRDDGRRFVAERAIVGEEITVPVLGNSGDDLQALPPVGIYPIGHPYFTNAAKYDPAACHEIVPPRGMSAAQIEIAQRLAIRCHEALQCDGMSRTDMIVTPDGPVVLEVNTIPGLTTASLLPKAAAHAGITFGALVDRLLEFAVAARFVRAESRA